MHDRERTIVCLSSTSVLNRNSERDMPKSQTVTWVDSLIWHTLITDKFVLQTQENEDYLRLKYRLSICNYCRINYQWIFKMVCLKFSPKINFIAVLKQTITGMSTIRSHRNLTKRYFAKMNFKCCLAQHWWLKSCPLIAVYISVYYY